MHLLVNGGIYLKADLSKPRPNITALANNGVTTNHLLILRCSLGHRRLLNQRLLDHWRRPLVRILFDEGAKLNQAAN